MKTFLIATNNNPPFDLGLFHNFITGLYNSGRITAWWHYLGGPVYIVQTRLEINQINSLVMQHMAGLHFLIIEVNPAHSQGFLPQAGWNWLGR